MDGQQLNTAVGLTIAAVGLVSWSLVLLAEPEHPVQSRVMWLLALGMTLVSSLALADVDWWVGVFAAVNRAVVAGSGVRALWLVWRGARAARREP